MLIDGLKSAHRSFGAFVACLLALVLAIGSIPLTKAYAYYSFGTVGVYAGS